MVQNIETRQSNSNLETDEEISTTFVRVMLVAEQNGISLKKFIEQTDRDPELNPLKQAVIDKNHRQIPAAYKLYENDLKVSLGSILIGDKIVIPKSLREWVKQVAHGDHATSHKIMEITQLVHWPGN